MAAAGRGGRRRRPGRAAGGEPGPDGGAGLGLAVRDAHTSATIRARFGHRKLAPRISPNKTIEGLLGGVVAGIVAGLCVALLAGAAPAQLPAVALVALFTVLFSVVGDLFESLLKRQRGVKDSSNLIPGHGGLLDRVDGVIAGLPAFALGKDILGF